MQSEGRRRKDSIGDEKIRLLFEQSREIALVQVYVLGQFGSFGGCVKIQRLNRKEKKFVEKEK